LSHVHCFFFFFSSRRRHTRSKRDWSSDVCSSDLPLLSHKIRSTSTTKTGTSRFRQSPAPTRWLGCGEFTIACSNRAPAANAGIKIGRASCRERVWVAGGAGGVEGRGGEGGGCGDE